MNTCIALTCPKFTDLDSNTAVSSSAKEENYSLVPIQGSRELALRCNSFTIASLKEINPVLDVLYDLAVGGIVDLSDARMEEAENGVIIEVVPTILPFTGSVNFEKLVLRGFFYLGLSYVDFLHNPEVYLEREPSNVYDSSAIAVKTKGYGERCGFLAREQAESLAPVLDNLSVIKQDFNVYVKSLGEAGHSVYIAGFLTVATMQH